MTEKTVSLITSLYRSEAHLERYAAQLREVAARLAQVDLRLELVFVANDASAAEREQIHAFARIPYLMAQALFVPRESLYVSWNRGVAATHSVFLGFWNVDDLRYADALIAGVAALNDGADLVDMPYHIRRVGEDAMVHPVMNAGYDPVELSPKRCLSPFFLFTRKLYERAGAFDPAFRIAGDLEWCWRDAVRQSAYRPLDLAGGAFLLHDANLSNGVQPLEWVEINLLLLRQGLYEGLRPVEPELMRERWEAWGARQFAIPPELGEWLWGSGARERYEAYQRERSAHPLLRRLRLALARRNLLTSAEWDAHHRPKIGKGQP